MINSKEPTLVKSSVLSSMDITNILSMLDEYDNLIDKYTGNLYTKQDIPKRQGAYFGMFGKPWYYDYVYRTYEEYLIQGNKTRDILLNTMPYEKILLAVSEALNRPVVLSSTRLNPPGIHVFANYTDKSIEIPVKNWHYDTFDKEYVEAWAIPISLPTNPCGVDYEYDGVRHRFNYSTNTLYGWKGNLFHSISDMTLLPSETRITIQCFTMNREGNTVLFW